MQSHMSSQVVRAPPDRPHAARRRGVGYRGLCPFKCGGYTSGGVPELMVINAPVDQTTIEEVQ